ncbi:MAG TPA: hypothetical protein VMU59_02870 [Caulobacteraceae bacterium]|nr:hypothetical protein [Caulobacteraceae bacterium]
MKRVALAQANQRLKAAQEALSRLNMADSYPSFVRAWSDFLVAANGIYAKLEQGAKGCGKSEAWFGRKKHDRKKDQLLCYLHHARNADEHGIEPVTSNASSIAVGGNGVIRRASFDWHEDGSPNIQIDADPGINIVIEAKGKLIGIYDHGDAYPPPEVHLCVKISDASPKGVGALAIAYFETILYEADQLPAGP